VTLLTADRFSQKAQPPQRYHATRYVSNSCYVLQAMGDIKVSERRIDRQTHDGSIYRASIASGGKILLWNEY